MDDHIEALLQEWEEAARRADAVVVRIEDFTRAGLAVPAKLVIEMARIEDELLEKLLAVRRARASDEPLH